MKKQYSHPRQPQRTTAQKFLVPGLGLAGIGLTAATSFGIKHYQDKKIKQLQTQMEEKMNKTVSIERLKI